MKVVSSVFGNGRLRAAFFMSMALAWSVFAAVLFLPPPGPASAQFVEQSTYGGTSTGSANAQTIVIPNLRGNTPGVVLRFIPGFTNTGPSTLNAGFGNIAVVRPSSIGNVALSGQELFAGELTCVTYNGTAYQLSCNVDPAKISAIVEFRGSATPRGTLIEDGSCVSRATYAPLFSVVGTTYGACDGSTTFALPDSRGTMFAALDGQGVNGLAGRISTATCATPNAVGLCGSQAHTLAQTELPAVSLTFTGNLISGLGATLPAAPLTSSGQTAANSGGAGVTGSPFGNRGTVDNFTPSGTISPLGSGSAHSVLNPVLLGRRAIKY